MSSLPTRPVQIYRRFKPFVIHAFKGGRGVSHYPGGYFMHKFTEGGSRIIGRPDGSIVLKPRKGRRLWGLYPVKHPAPKLPNKEPFLNPMTLAVVNPISSRAPGARRWRGLRSSGAIHRRGKSKVKRWHMSKKRHHRARHNPLGHRLSAFKDDGMDALSVTGGLVGVPFLLGMVPLPAFAQSGIGRYAVRIGAAILAGAAVSMVSRRAGRMVAVGALAGVAAEVASGFVSGAMPMASTTKAPGVSSDTGVELTVLPTSGLSSYTGRGLAAYTGF